jgi:hypothetical protein
MTEQPFVWVTDAFGKRRRWYPNQFLESMELLSAQVGGTAVPDHLDPEMLDPAQCRAALPGLRAGLDNLTRFVTLVERRAKEELPTVCAQCGSRFYPLRSDARYCGGTCRQRAYRRVSGRD